MVVSGLISAHNREREGIKSTSLVNLDSSLKCSAFSSTLFTYFALKASVSSEVNQRQVRFTNEPKANFPALSKISFLF